MLVVSDILRHKGTDVVTIAPTASVHTLVTLLAEHRIGSAVVSADGVHVDGIVSERDVVAALAEHGPQVLAMPIQQICSTDVTFAGPGDHLELLMTVMTEKRFRHLPVVVDDELRGLVSIGDVVKARVGELEVEQQALTNYITGSR